MPESTFLVEPAHHRDLSAPCDHCRARWVTLPDGSAEMVHDDHCYEFGIPAEPFEGMLPDNP